MVFQLKDTKNTWLNWHHSFKFINLIKMNKFNNLTYFMQLLLEISLRILNTIQDIEIQVLLRGLLVKHISPLVINLQNKNISSVWSWLYIVLRFSRVHIRISPTYALHIHKLWMTFRILFCSNIHTELIVTNNQQKIVALFFVHVIYCIRTI